MHRFVWAVIITLVLSPAFGSDITASWVKARDMTLRPMTTSPITAWLPSKGRPMLYVDISTCETFVATTAEIKADREFSTILGALRANGIPEERMWEGLFAHELSHCLFGMDEKLADAASALYWRTTYPDDANNYIRALIKVRDANIANHGEAYNTGPYLKALIQD